MDFVLSKKERNFLQIANNAIMKWRNILYLDPIWNISIDVFEDTEVPEDVLARMDTSNSEYYIATIELSHSLFNFKEKDFTEKINEIACHELLHLVMIDFYRTIQLTTKDNEEMRNELQYKFEQFTSRLEKAFMAVLRSHDDQRDDLEKANDKLCALRDLYLHEYPEKRKDIEKLLEIKIPSE